MAKAIAARLLGDDYQSRMFWIQVCRMFDDRSRIVKVELEAENVKSLDDIVVHFDPPLPYDDEEVKTEYYQVKFHVTHQGAFTWQALIDPAFINATSFSLLQRIRNAQQQYAPEGTGCRFIICSPWMIDPNDHMAGVWSNIDGRILWDRLVEGGVQSKMGKIREAWKRHLGLTTDEELRKTLAPVRIQIVPNFDALNAQLNDKLKLAGFAPLDEQGLTQPYDDLSRSFIKRGRIAFTRAKIEEICKKENLWRGRVIVEPGTHRIGIRSFIRATEYLEDATDDLLCLACHFDGRHLKDGSSWDQIYTQVETFLRRSAVKSGPHHIHVPTHVTIAFTAGYCLDTKSGVNIVPIQSTSGRVIWRPDGNDPIAGILWQTETVQTSGNGHELAVAVSVTHDILNDTVKYINHNLPHIGRVLHLRQPTPGVNSIRDGSHAFYLAQNLISTIRSERKEDECGLNLHFFWAAPNAFVFFVGQMARNLGPCVLYEHDFESGRQGAYQPSLRLPFISHTPDPQKKEV